MSLQLGTVRLLETFLVHREQLEGTEAAIVDEAVARVLSEALPRLPNVPIDVVIGTGGNVSFWRSSVVACLWTPTPHAASTCIRREESLNVCLV